MTQVLLSSPMTDDEIKTREGEHYPRSLLQSWQWLSPRWNPGLSETKIDHLGQGDSGAGDLVSCASPGARRSPCREARSPHSRGFPWGLEQAEAEAGQASNGHRLLYPSSPRGPLLAQCSGGRGRSARALQPGATSTRGASPRPHRRPRLAKLEKVHPGRDGGGRGGENCFSRSRRAAAGTRAGLRDRGEGASTEGSQARSPSVSPAAQLGEGPGRPRGGKVSRQQKWPGIAGVGGRGAGRLAPPSREGRKEKSGGKRGWAWGAGGSDLNRFRPPRGGGSRSGEARTASSRMARTRLAHPPPLFFYANVYLNARAHTEIVRLFFPLGEKTRRVKEERAKRRTPRQALHCVAAGRGDAAATLPLSPGPAAYASGRAS